MAEKIFVFEGNGRIVQHTGNYTDLRENSFSDNEYSSDENNKNNKNSKDENNSSKKSNTDYKNATESGNEKPLKFSCMEKREYEEVDGVTAELEEKIRQIEKNINEASTVK